MFTPYQQAIFANRQPLIAQIKEFASRRNISIWRPIRHDKSKIRLHSWLAEMRFGLFFDSFAERISYDQLFSFFNRPAQTPDWSFTLNGQLIISDTLRLNRQSRHSLEKALEEDFDRFVSFPDQPSLRQGSITLSSEFNYGQQSKVTSKERKYRDLIRNRKAPFIISIDPSFEAFIDSLDTFDAFVGHSKYGLFYTDEHIRKNVSGVLLSDRSGGNDFVWYPNENCAYPLLDTNLAILEKYKYSGR
jgi:hypothetical protein